MYNFVQQAVRDLSFRAGLKILLARAGGQGGPLSRYVSLCYLVYFYCNAIMHREKANEWEPGTKCACQTPVPNKYQTCWSTLATSRQATLHDLLLMAKHFAYIYVSKKACLYKVCRCAHIRTVPQYVVLRPDTTIILQ